MSTWRRRQMMAAAKVEPFVWPDTLQKVAYISKTEGVGGFIDTKLLQTGLVLDFTFAFMDSRNNQVVCGTRRSSRAQLWEDKLSAVGGSDGFYGDFPGGFDTNFHHYVLSSAGFCSYDNTVLFNTPTTPQGDDNRIFLYCWGNGPDSSNYDANPQSYGKFANYIIKTVAERVVFDGVPVRTLDSWVNAAGVTVPTGTVGLFDMVSKELFTSNTNSNFTAGPDITD